MTRQSNASEVPSTDKSPIRDEFLMGMPLHLLETMQAEMGARLAHLEGSVFSLRRRLAECEQHLRRDAASSTMSESARDLGAPVLAGNARIKCAAD